MKPPAPVTRTCRPFQCEFLPFDVVTRCTILLRSPVSPEPPSRAVEPPGVHPVRPVVVRPGREVQRRPFDFPGLDLTQHVHQQLGGNSLRSAEKRVECLSSADLECALPAQLPR